MSVVTKFCPCCEEVLPAKSFAWDAAASDFLATYCRECDKIGLFGVYIPKPAPLEEVCRPTKKARVKMCHRCGEQETPSPRHWYCVDCRKTVRRRSNRRSDPAERGYGKDHQNLREWWDRRVAKGTVRCARGADCKYAENGLGGLIHAGEPWDLGHVDGDRSRYAGPEHRSCNRATTGRKHTRKVSLFL